MSQTTGSFFYNKKDPKEGLFYLTISIFVFV